MKTVILYVHTIHEKILELLKVRTSITRIDPLDYFIIVAVLHAVNIVETTTAQECTRYINYTRVLKKIVILTIKLRAELQVIIYTKYIVLFITPLYS